MEIHQKTSGVNYQKLKRCINQKLRLRNVDAMHGRIESGAVVKSRKGIIGVEGGKGICYQWKEKRPVFARRTLQFPSRNPRSCANTRTHCRHTFFSEPLMTRGRSVSRKRSIQGKSNPGITLRQPCIYYLHGICTRTLCEYWHPPEYQFFMKQKRVVSQEIKGRSKAISTPKN